MENTGIIFRDDDGIEKEIRIDQYMAIYPYDRLVTKIYAEPTTNGKKTEAYDKIRHELGDDWYTDLSDNWSFSLPTRVMVGLAKYFDGRE